MKGDLFCKYGTRFPPFQQKRGIRNISKRQYPAGMVWWMIHKWLKKSGAELLIILMPRVKNEHFAHGDVDLCPERKKGVEGRYQIWGWDGSILISKETQIALWPPMASQTLNMPALREKNKRKYFKQNHHLTLQIVPEACEVNKNLPLVSLPC